MKITFNVISKDLNWQSDDRTFDNGLNTHLIYFASWFYSALN